MPGSGARGLDVGVLYWGPTGHGIEVFPGRVDLTGRLEDKVAIVTGGASGIGRAICQRFGSEGAKVAVADRNIVGAEETLAQMGANSDTAMAIDVNISNASQVERMVEQGVAQYGKVDILVNGAAILIRTPDLVDVDEIIWDSVSYTHLRAHET